MRKCYIVERIEPEGFDTLGNARHSVHDTEAFGTMRKAWAAIPGQIAKFPDYCTKPKPERSGFRYSLKTKDSYIISSPVYTKNPADKPVWFSVVVRCYELQ